MVLPGPTPLKFNAVSATSGTFTVYLDDIEDYGPGTSGNAPLTVQFTDLSTKMEDTAHTSWAWDFQNNGSIDSTEQNPLFIYMANGTYTVKMTATNAGGSDSETKTGYITVGTVTPPPVANFTATPRTGTAPLAVQFNDTSTNSPTSWKWAFKNATVGWTQFSTVRNASYTFPAGTYDINHTATNTAGSDDEIKTGYITVSTATLPPVSNFTATPRTGTAPLAVQFNDTSTNSPTSWKWAFKNATVGWTQFSTVRNASYTFPAGTYDINLTATNTAGSDDEIKTGYITVSTATLPPVSNFTATPKTGTAPLAVQFNDTSTNSPTSWKWAFKNATVGWTQFSTVRNASYTFPAGTYDINLTATNTAGSDDEIKTGYITVTTIPYIDVSISGSIDNWNFQTGVNEDTTAVDLTIDTNMNKWTVGSMDALTGSKPAGTAGKMAEYSGSAYVLSGTVLANTAQVKSGTGNYITLTGSNQAVQAGTATGITSYDIGIKQQIDQTDPALDGDHRYRIVITFTGAAA